MKEIRKNSINLDSEEIWKWYTIVTYCINTRQVESKYCQDNGLNYSTYVSRKRIILSHKYTKPNQYEKDVNFYNEFKKTDMSCVDFCNRDDCKISGFNANRLSHIINHIKVIEIIEKFKREGRLVEQEDPMNFLPVKPKVNRIVPNQEISHSFESAQNEIELKIKEGIRVIISSNVESRKIIKIIELLKDL